MNREDIYKERKSIEEFGVDEKGTLNNALFDVLFSFDYVSRSSDIEKKILDLYNEAYYICTLILLEKRPYFQIKRYSDIIGTDENSFSFDANKVIIVMSMVYVYLMTLDLITNDIDKTTSLIKREFTGCDGNMFETISSVLEKDTWPSNAHSFYPLHFPKDEETSDFWKSKEEFPKSLADFINSEKNTFSLSSNEKANFPLYTKFQEMLDDITMKDEVIGKLKSELKNEREKTIALERENRDLKTQHEEDKARMMAEFGAPVITELDSDGHEIKQQMADTDTFKALAEAQEQNKLSQKQIKEMEEKIQKLRCKLGDKNIPLESLADGLKRYALVHGLAKGEELLVSLCYILKRERVWVENTESLENFFIAAEEENRKALVKVENNKGGVVQITKNEKK